MPDRPIDATARRGAQGSIYAYETRQGTRYRFTFRDAAGRQTTKRGVLVTVGGTIPADDIPELKQLGIAEVFTPGAPTQDIVDFIRSGVPA